MTVLVVVTIVHTMFLERMLRMVSRGSCQMTRGEAQTDGSSLRGSSRPGAVQW